MMSVIHQLLFSFTQDHVDWVIGDPGAYSILHLVVYVVLLHSHRVMICVFQPSNISEIQRSGLLCFHLGGIVIELDWPDLSLSSVQILQGCYRGTMLQILQELVRGISDRARVLTWDPGGASLCIAFHRGARRRIWMLSSCGGYWHSVELPFSLDSRDSQGHSWSETFILTEGFGTQGSSRWQLVTLNGESWDPGIQLFSTSIPLVLFCHSGFEMMHAGLYRLRSRIAFSRRVWDPGI